MLIVQNERIPGTIQNSLLDLLRREVVRIRVCSAYMSLSGSELLFDGICRASSALASKTIVASLDFGLTEPEALRFWKRARNCTVLVAGAERLGEGILRPNSAFHSKFYVFNRDAETVGGLVSSANLTNRGLTVNSEVGWLETKYADPDAINIAWDNIIASATPLTDEILGAYSALHVRAAANRQTNELEPLPPPVIGPLGRYPVFGDAVRDPDDYPLMWVQSRGMQGGAGTQLELPRGTHQFFGARYTDYEFERVQHIAEPVLVSGMRQWRDRHLTWHGDNRMERINLPSLSMGGFGYADSLILFRRLGRNRYELRVHPWDSDMARAYVEASRQSGLIYRIGARSDRIAGFIPEQGGA